MSMLGWLSVMVYIMGQELDSWPITLAGLVMAATATVQYDLLKDRVKKLEERQ